MSDPLSSAARALNSGAPIAPFVDQLTPEARKALRDDLESWNYARMASEGQIPRTGGHQGPRRCARCPSWHSFAEITTCGRCARAQEQLDEVRSAAQEQARPHADIAEGVALCIECRGVLHDPSPRRGHRHGCPVYHALG